MISTSGRALIWEGGAGFFMQSATRNSISLPFWVSRFRRAPERKTAKLRKELLEALALKVPFETASGWSSLPEVSNQVPWPGRLEGEKPFTTTLMPDKRRELHTISPASHTLLSVDCLYQMTAAECKGEVLGRGSLLSWFGVYVFLSPLRG